MTDKTCPKCGSAKSDGWRAECGMANSDSFQTEECMKRQIAALEEAVRGAVVVIMPVSLGDWADLRHNEDGSYRYIFKVSSHHKIHDLAQAWLNSEVVKRLDKPIHIGYV